MQSFAPFSLIILLSLTLPLSARAADMANGRSIFEKECAVCHGAEGRGDGPAAPLFDPKPRNFDKGLYKIRSTQNGELPTDSDIRRTLERGLPGAGMPAFRHLDEGSIIDLMEYLKTLGQPEGSEESWFDLYEIPPPVEIPPRPASSAARIEEGKKLFVTMGCEGCHGKTGLGDGKPPEEMLDDWGNPLHPRNFSLGIFKGGGQPEDLYTRIATGLNGTPMTGFWHDALKPDERWALVEFVLSLGKPFPVEPVVPGSVTVAAAKAPTSGRDAGWDALPATEVARMPLAGGWLSRFTPLKVRIAREGEDIAIRLDWQEAVDSCPSARVTFFPSATLGAFAVGSADAPAVVWEWRKDTGPAVLISKGPGAETADAAKISAEADVAGSGQHWLVMKGRAPEAAEKITIAVGGCLEKGKYLTASAIHALK